jgi:hypothetical protein
VPHGTLRTLPTPNGEAKAAALQTHVSFSNVRLRQSLGKNH